MSRFAKRFIRFTGLGAMLVVLSACPGKSGGGPGLELLLLLNWLGGGNNNPSITYGVAGTVTGLGGASESVTLQNNGGDEMTLTANGSFEFPTKLSNGAGYNVQVTGTAGGTFCMASNNTGVIASSSVSNVSVVCSTTTFVLSVDVSGLDGSGLVFQNNGADNLSVATNGVNNFTTEVPENAGYNVSVSTQPSDNDQICTPSSPSGTMSGPVTVSVVCAPDYYGIGGTIVGLNGSGLKLRNNNNSSDEQVHNFPDTAFTFGVPVAEGAGYAVTVSQQPVSPNQTCTVSGGGVADDGSGTMGAADVTDVLVTCANNPYDVSGSITGLTGSDTVTLRMNGGSDTVVSVASPGFSWTLVDYDAYAVTVGSVSNSKLLCAVSGGGVSNDGTGTIDGANVTNIQVSCIYRYDVNASVSGLTGDGLVIKNGSDTVTINAADGSGPFTVTTLADGSAYSLSVQTQPSGTTNESCSITTNRTGTLSGADVTATVVCEVCDIVHAYGGSDFEAWTFDPGASPATVSICVAGLNGSDMHLAFTNTNASPTTLPDGSSSGVYSVIPPLFPEIIGDKEGNMQGTGFENIVPDHVTAFNNGQLNLNPSLAPTPALTPPPPLFDKSGTTVGTTTHTWFDDLGGSIPTTLRGLTTLSNGKTLKVWVANDMWVTDNTNNRINATKVAAVVSKFGTDSPNIYDMVRALVGAEWGTHSFPSQLISSTQDIVHILLFDIDSNGSWGTVGFFYGCNNFLDAATSCPTNEALVFFIDAPTFGERTGTSWEVTDYAPTLLLGALAHEFQHMIFFYQKSVTYNISADTWLNELSSLTVQDMTATHIGGAGTGPANDYYGRLAGYVYTPVCDVTIWGENGSGDCTTLDSYETAFAFGGYLVRHYGGSSFLRDIVQSNTTGMDAIDYALTQASAGIDSNEALRRWGASLSMDPSLGTLPAIYGYPEVVESDLYGTGYDMTLQLADMWALGYSPRIYTTPPSTIRANATVNWRKHSDFTGVTNSSNTTITAPANTLLTITVGPH